MHACKILVIQGVVHNLTGVVYVDLTSLCFVWRGFTLLVEILILWSPCGKVHYLQARQSVLGVFSVENFLRKDNVSKMLIPRPFS